MSPVATLTLSPSTVVVVSVLRHEAEVIRETRLRIVDTGIASTVPFTECVDVIHVSDQVEFNRPAVDLFN